MRVLFVTLLALAVVAAPAAQAFACRCVDQSAAQEDACCCGGDVAPCDCCGSEDERETGAMERCPCSQTSPLAQDAPTIDLPAPAAAVATPFADVYRSQASQCALVTPEPRDPSPDVSPPLLI